MEYVARDNRTCAILRNAISQVGIDGVSRDRGFSC